MRVSVETIEDDELPINRIARDGGSFDWLDVEPDLYAVADTRSRLLEFGSIVLLPFPFADLSTAKLWPAFILPVNSVLQA